MPRLSQEPGGTASGQSMTCARQEVRPRTRRLTGLGLCMRENEAAETFWLEADANLTLFLPEHWHCSPALTCEQDPVERT